MYYFASDIHLGLPAGIDPEKRERLFVQWLDQAAQDAEAIFLVGDIFDFWYEYRHVVPKGFTRTLGKFSELSDRGIPIHFFGGNHDIWTFRYLHDECGLTLHHDPYTLFELGGRRVVIGHGDVLGPRINFAGRRNPLSVLHTVTSRNTPLLQQICLFADISIVQSCIRYKRAARLPFWANGSNIQPSAHWVRKDFDCNVTRVMNHKTPNKGLTARDAPYNQKPELIPLPDHTAIN